MSLCEPILILRMEEDRQHFWHIILYYFKKGENTTEMQRKICAVYGEGARLIKHVKSGCQTFLVLLTFRLDNSLLWGCLMHWQMFSNTPGLYPLEANNGS